jgi:hypothetical protein
MLLDMQKAKKAYTPTYVHPYGLEKARPDLLDEKMNQSSLDQASRPKI